MKLAALAGHLAVNPSTAMRMVDRLRAAGMVSRRTNPEVRREVILELTAPGRRVVRDGLEARRREIAALVERMPPGRRSGLVAGLVAFSTAGGESPLTLADEQPV
jgi:DNA-binding MarR family transcriptional regulator